MDDKFNLDELKDLLSKCENDNSKISVDSLSEELNDFNEIRKTDKNEKVIVGFDVKNNEIIDDVVKPDFVSITGTFEAVRSEKNSKKTLDFSENNIEIAENSVTQQKTKSKSIEIKDEIEQKRYFSTDEFNSIKNKKDNDNTPKIKESLISYIKGEEEEDDGEDEYYKPVDPTEEIEDYAKPEEREVVIHDLKKIKTSASWKFILTLIFTIFSGVIYAALQFGFSIPGLVVTSGSKLVLTIAFSLSLIATIVNFNTVFKGLISAFKLKFSFETMIAFAFIFNCILDIMYLIGNVSFDGNYVSFDFVYILFLCFNIYSKKIIAKNILKNFLIASSKGEKMVIDRPKSEEIANDLIRETGFGGDLIYASKSKFVTNFIHNSFQDFEFYDKGYKFNVFCFLAILIISFVIYFTTQDITRSVAYISGAFCVSVPIVYSYAFALIVFSNSNRTRRMGGAIIGSNTSKILQDTETIIVDDGDVFKVELNGVRLSSGVDINDCFKYLVALYNSVGGPLKKLFIDCLGEEVVSVPRADEIYYADGKGHSCLINSKVFVVGNKKMMDHYGIEVDESEYDLIYQHKTKNVLFIAYDRKLLCVFLLSYSLERDVSRALTQFSIDDLNVAMTVRDPNITNDLFENLYKCSDKNFSVKLMNYRTAKSFLSKFDTKSEAPSILLSNTGLKGIASAFHGSKTMLLGVKSMNIIRMVCAIISLIVFTYLLNMSEPSVILPAKMLSFQFLWSLPLLFLSLFSKTK